MKYLFASEIYPFLTVIDEEEAKESPDGLVIIWNAETIKQYALPADYEEFDVEEQILETAILIDVIADQII